MGAKWELDEWNDKGKKRKGKEKGLPAGSAFLLSTWVLFGVLFSLVYINKSGSVWIGKLDMFAALYALNSPIAVQARGENGFAAFSTFCGISFWLKLFIFIFICFIWSLIFVYILENTQKQIIAIFAALSALSSHLKKKGKKGFDCCKYIFQCFLAI